MGAPGKAGEHGHGVVAVARFAKDVCPMLIAYDDGGVRREHGGAVRAMGEGGEDVPGLGLGASAGVFLRVFAGQRARFGAVRRQDFKRDAHAFQKGAAARRTGSKYQGACHGKSVCHVVKIPPTA
jgi:hypothetical protein